MSVNCIDGAADMFVDGQWTDAAYCWLSAGGDPTLSVVLPLFMYGIILLSYFIVGESPLIPSVVSLILAGVIFQSFPATATTIIGVAVLFTLAIGGLALTWRLGR